MTATIKIPYELTNLDDTRFRDLFENNSDGIYVSTVEGKVIDVNKAALEITGFTSKKEFAMQNTGDHYVNPKERKKFHLEIKKHGFVKDFEVTLKRRSGTEVICLLTSSALRDAKGKVIGYQGIIRDITEQRRKQKVQEVLLKITQAATSSGDVKSLLKQLHRELSQLINVDNFYVALYDEEAKAYSFPYYADEYDKINEFEQMKLKKSLTDYVRRTGKALFVDEAKRKKLKRKGEAIMIGTNSPIWLGSPLITSRGVIGVVVVQSYSDPKMYTTEDLELLVFVSGQIARVIQQKQNNEAIRLSEKRFRDLFENNRDGIYTSTIDGKIVDVNNAALEITGYKTKKEFASLNTSEHYQSLEERKRFQQEIEKKGYVKDFEFNLKKKHGEVVCCLLTSSVLKDSTGNIVGYQGIIRDISEQRQHQKIQDVVFQISQAVVVTSDIKGLIGIVHKQLNELINAENFYVALYDQKTDSYTFPYCVDQYDQGADNS
ncbi:MAG: PAS domain S-box protein, partial [Flavobacteriales bacterium]|nr:PAS domain S-box protein [Flavobacteriales bacterium]